MVKLRILVPEGTINYIKNPALRYDTTDWNAQGSAISRVLTRARFGIASLKVVTTGAALREGAFFRVSALSGISDAITVSAYVRGAGRVRIRLDDNSTGGAEYPSQNVQLTDDRWTRISVTGRSTGGNDLRLYVETDEAAAVIRTFYIDGAQLERKSYATSYCDGDQEGCRWNGIYHGSASERPAGTRAGGRWVQLAGEEREAEDLYMTVAGGLGAAPITNNIQKYSIQEGGYHQNSKVEMRPITLTFHAKHSVDDRYDPVSLAHLHELRRMLLDVVKPDKTAGDQDIWFEYSDGSIPLQFQARYDGGLEGEWDVRNQFINSFPLKLLAVSPFMQEDSQEASELDFQESLNANYAMGRINGRWTNLNYGMNGACNDAAIDNRGRIYAVGAFSTVNNNAAALSPLLTSRVAYWDGEKWVSIANSLAGGTTTLYAIAIAPNNDVYVGGSFTSIHGTAANYIAKYTASTGVWSAMGTGMNAVVNGLTVAPNGDVYAAGGFTTAGGVNCYYIARWDGTKWNRCGQYGGVNDYANDVKVSPDGTMMYLGGTFTREYGPAGANITGVAQYNIAAGTFSAMGSGLDIDGAYLAEGVNTLYISPEGEIYAGGFFYRSGATTVNTVAQWVGGAWVPMGDGFPGDPALGYNTSALSGMGNGQIVAAGWFNVTTGNLPLNCMAIWNGSTWTNLDAWAAFYLVGITTICINPKTGDIFISPTQLTNVLTSGFTTINNTGTTQIHPVIYLKGPGRCKWIENQTTGRRLYLNLLLQNGEEVTIDIGRGTITSTMQNNRLSVLLSGSDFRSFRLMPGDNTLAVFMHDDVNAQTSLQYIPRHWGADSTADTDGF